MQGSCGEILKIVKKTSVPNLYGISCFTLDFIVFFKSLKRFRNDPSEYPPVSRPPITSPRAVNHDESRSLVFELPKISLVPILVGSLSTDFDSSSSPTTVAPRRQTRYRQARGHYALFFSNDFLLIRKYHKGGLQLSRLIFSSKILPW